MATTLVRRHPCPPKCVRGALRREGMVEARCGWWGVPSSPCPFKHQCPLDACAAPPFPSPDPNNKSPSVCSPDSCPRLACPPADPVSRDPMPPVSCKTIFFYNSFSTCRDNDERKHGAYAGRSHQQRPSRPGRSRIPSDSTTPPKGLSVPGMCANTWCFGTSRDRVPSLAALSI